MTDYDPKPTAYHQQEAIDDGKGGLGALGWIIGLLVLGAIIWALFLFLDVDQTSEGNLELPTVSVEGGDVDLPEFDVDTADVDVTLPKVELDVTPGSVDVDLPKEGPEADDISPLDGAAPDVDVDVDVDVEDDPR